MLYRMKQKSGKNYIMLLHILTSVLSLFSDTSNTSKLNNMLFRDYKYLLFLMYALIVCCGVFLANDRLILVLYLHDFDTDIISL